MPKIERALISVTDKNGVVDFARELNALGIELISTGGTAKALREGGLAVRDVSEVTGFPEMLDGRVKTMHPKITGGILAMRGKPEHMAALAAHEIAPIDMVVVNLYAFEKVAANPDADIAELIENIDIGGPTMIRSAAKNYRDVAIVVSPSDYPGIAAELRASGGSLAPATRLVAWHGRPSAPRPITTAPSAHAWRASTTRARCRPHSICAPTDCSPFATAKIRINRRRFLRYAGRGCRRRRATTG